MNRELIERARAKLRAVRGPFHKMAKEADMTTVDEIRKVHETYVAKGGADDFERVQKMHQGILESLAKEFQAREPSLSWPQAIAKATCSETYTKLHRLEKTARFGSGF